MTVAYHRRHHHTQTWRGAVVLALSVIAAFTAGAHGSGAPADENKDAAAKTSGGTLLIRGGELFDATGAPPRPLKQLLVRSGRIDSIDGDEADPAAMVIDATGKAVLPGLIDLHVHFGAPAGPPLGFAAAQQDYQLYRPQVRQSLLAAGVTSIRSVGDPLDYILDVRSRIASGELTGPRVFCAGPIFTGVGGHPASTIYRANPWLVATTTRQVDQEDQAREEVRQLAALGVDGVKCVYDNGAGRLPRLSLPVLAAIASEARQRGLWVAVHTGSEQEVADAITAGAGTIEHGAGTRLSDATLTALRTHRIVCVPTLAVWQASGASTGDRLAEVRQLHEASIAIAAGTDTQGPKMHFGQSLHRELQLLVEAGVSASDALLSATRIAGLALGKDKELGTIQPSWRADLLIVEGRPWENIAHLSRIVTVIQDGRVVWTRPAAP